MGSFAGHFDPGRSLAAAIGWLVFALSLIVALVAIAWVDDIVRSNLLDQRGRELERTAQRIAAELNLELALRLQSVRALAAIVTTDLGDEDREALGRSLDNLQRAYPDFEWIAVANQHGQMLARTEGAPESARVGDRDWFMQGQKGPAIFAEPSAQTASSATESSATAHPSEPVVHLVASAFDARGRPVGVIGAQMSRRWLLDIAGRLGEEQRASSGIRAVVVDQADTVVLGPASLQGTRWHSAAEHTTAAKSPPPVDSKGARLDWRSQVEQLADGEPVLAARATPTAGDALHALGWRVAVFQPLQDAARRARILQGQIAAVLLGLGILAAIAGALAARRVTHDLETIALSADAVRAGAAQEIVIPPGRNEAARLGHALAELLGSLQRERHALQTLNAELDQRVAARTLEVERLAEQERYAAVVRERLKIARDLHDTLAHSMMAMLAEIRLLKRLAVADPGALTDELAHAEEAAHQGLKEARDAIARMRFNPVRDEGLAAALADFVNRFIERSGIAVDFETDAPAGAFADDRAEVLFRIAEEALHNVEIHAGASHVTLSLRVTSDGRGLNMRIADDGIGFDPDGAYPGHYGLAGLREQAQLIGAVLAIRSAPGRGTTVSVAWQPPTAA